MAGVGTISGGELKPLLATRTRLSKNLRALNAKMKPRDFFFRSLLLAALWLAVAAVPRAGAFTAAEAGAIYAAHVKAFCATNTDGGYFRTSTDGGVESFWQSAEQLEMLLDVYERTTNAGCLTLFSNNFDGFVAKHGETWEQNDYNDDIFWMVIASARAHQFTGNLVYLKAAKSNFDLCYARAWSTNLGGGLWWRTDNHSKNACVNGPGAIAAYLLYQILGDTNYLAKSKAVYEWERQALFDPKTGKIFDNMTAEGRIHFKSFTYNEGTFIGAANFLNYTNDARLAADYTRNSLCQDGLLPDYEDQASDAAGFNGIFARWCAKFMRDRGLQGEYLGWLQANADAAWKCRRKSDNLAWSIWSQRTPEETLYSWPCSCAVVMMNVVPATSLK